MAIKPIARDTARISRDQFAKLAMRLLPGCVWETRWITNFEQEGCKLLPALLLRKHFQMEDLLQELGIKL